MLEHPREAVWRLMADAEAVASCIPGMKLDGPLVDGHASGRMEVALGPIKASFAGQGTVATFPAEYRQVITGKGGDRKSGSNASGEVAYRLRQDAGPRGEEVTRVEVELSYSLTGPLAQFSRSSLVRDLVSRVGESFAQNLDAKLFGARGSRNGAGSPQRRFADLARRRKPPPRRRGDAPSPVILCEAGASWPKTLRLNNFRPPPQ